LAYRNVTIAIRISQRANTDRRVILLAKTGSERIIPKSTIANAGSIAEKRLKTDGRVGLSFEKEAPRKRKAILNHAKKFRSTEAAILRQATKILDNHPSPREDYDTIPTLLFELGPQLKDLFTDFVLRCGGKAKKWELLNPPPAPSWSGTNYWSEDAESCVRCIIQESRKATDQLQKLVQKG
jgi:hypothetical protein